MWHFLYSDRKRLCRGADIAGGFRTDITNWPTRRHLINTSKPRNILAVLHVYENWTGAGRRLRSAETLTHTNRKLLDCRVGNSLLLGSAVVMGIASWRPGTKRLPPFPTQTVIIPSMAQKKTEAPHSYSSNESLKIQFLLHRKHTASPKQRPTS
jgi:hypothetical protein